MDNTRRKFLKTAGLVAISGIVGASVPGIAKAHGEVTLEPDLTIGMGEFFFQLHGQEPNEPIRMEAGKKYLVFFENEGQVTHEIHFGREPDLEEREYKVNLLGNENDHENHGFIALILQPGETATMQFFIPESKRGEWEIGCFMLGHYEAGQKTTLIVE